MTLKQGEKVDLIIGQKTDLGYTVLINQTFEGLIYHNEIFENLSEGSKTEGYIKKLREDGKIDVSLRAQGFKNIIDADIEKILKELELNKGKLPIGDKSDSETIKLHLQMSKKAFKRAVGSLYRQKKIRIYPNSIVLI